MSTTGPVQSDRQAGCGRFGLLERPLAEAAKEARCKSTANMFVTRNVTGDGFGGVTQVMN